MIEETINSLLLLSDDASSFEKEMIEILQRYISKHDYVGLIEFCIKANDTLIILKRFEGIYDI